MQGAGRTLNRGGIFRVRRKLFFDFLASLEINIIRTEKNAQVRPTCSVFEQYMPWTEPQLNLMYAVMKLKFQPHERLNIRTVKTGQKYYSRSHYSKVYS